MKGWSAQLDDWLAHAKGPLAEYAAELGAEVGALGLEVDSGTKLLSARCELEIFHLTELGKEEIRERIDALDQAIRDLTGPDHVRNNSQTVPTTATHLKRIVNSVVITLAVAMSVQSPARLEWETVLVWALAAAFFVMNWSTLARLFQSATKAFRLLVLKWKARRARRRMARVECRCHEVDDLYERAHVHCREIFFLNAMKAEKAFAPDHAVQTDDARLATRPS